MKACPTCGRLYPADAGFCPVDGAALVSASIAPVAQTGDDTRLGQVLFERYEVRRVVADGGMGRVYEALDLVDRRNVAVKVLHPEVARDPIQVERFKREFEVSKLLPHEHIVDVLDFRATADGSYALVMEFLFGEELRGTLDREKCLPPGRLIRMLSQVAIGLDEAHNRRFVHRDLKPDNLFLGQTSDGDIVKLLDFGSVKDKAEGAKKLTVMGTTIGSPFYMSPEQAQGLETLDHRADIWALGAIVFESVTGSVPFVGKNGPTILLEILTKEAPPPSVKGKDARYPVPPSLDPVLARTFKKVPALRFESVGSFADALGQAYGLQGTHLDWAKTPEAELTKAVEENLPALMSAEKQAEVRTATDDFFGEGDALGEAIAPAPPSVEDRPRPDAVQHKPKAALAALAATSGASPQARQRTDSAEGEAPLPGLPKNNGNTAVIVMVVAVLLIAAAAFALL